MSRPLRPASERYSVCCSVPDSGSFCSQDGRHFSTDCAEDEDTPIFSISKSSVDVLSASPHLRDAAFSRADKPRCASTSEQHCGVNTFQSPTLNASPLTKHNLETHNRPLWLSNMQRWSSCSAQSRSSTPDTVIFRGSPPDKAADSSKMASPPPSPLSSPLPETPSPELTSPELTSPELTSPELTPAIPLSSAQVLQLNQDDVSLNSPQFSPLRAKFLSPLPARELLCFVFPSPASSSVSLEKFEAEDPLYAVRNSEACAGELFTEVLPGSLELSFENQDPPSPDFVNFPLTLRPSLVPSFSDPYLGACRRCCDRFCRKAVELSDLTGSKPREEMGTMTRRAELMDVGVQTDSLCASWWGLKRNMSNLGSPSLLGSPPGSQLNLRSPVGSHFNLLSPSSSMFHICSDDEDSRAERDISFETSSNTDSITERRSCLKNRDKTLELGRRSSMKQVQWDEDGMTWEVHGAALDPEELNMAIQKHLELKSEEDDEQKPLRKSTKKNRAPKPPTQLRLSMVPDHGKGTEQTEGTVKTEGTVRTEGTEGERTGRTEGERTGQDEEAEEKQTRRTSLTPGPLQRKRRTFRRPVWCGGSRKHQD